VLAKEQPIEGLDVTKAAPVDNERKLSDMILECNNRFTVSPDVIYIAHSIPFAKGKAGRFISETLGMPVIWLSGLPCSITHMAVKLAVAQIEKGKHNRILVFGADKAYCDRERRFFGTIMGDAVVGMMLEQGAGLHEIVVNQLDTVLIAPEGENSDPVLIQKYRDTLPLLLRDAYKRCLSTSGLRMVDYIAPHTPNRGVWDVFSKLTGVDREKILDEKIVHTGHFNSNDSFYHYFTHCENNTIRPGQTAMLINPGFGGTRGCTILRRKQNVNN
jgi:3-oxoacyl-[acyl-carrier-protein] synthase-3